MWKSKAQKGVTLSSSEAEFVALSEAVKEVLFVLRLLNSMGIKVELPIKVMVDNKGAIFMANNVAISQRTKHIDTRSKFVTQYILEGIITVEFVGTSKNFADMFTKNVEGSTLEEHNKTMMENVQE